MTTTIKTCFKCLVEKPIDGFYRHSKMADGYLGKCKGCTIKDTAKTKAARPDYYKQYEKERYMLPHRVAQRKAYLETDAGKASATKAKKKFIENNPVKRMCHCIVSNSIRKGTLVRSNCEVCGNPKAQAHHDDYTKPLDVRWLCPKHHAEHHKSLRNMIQ